MGKDIIKQILRENLGQLPVREAEPKAEEGQGHNNEKYEKEYAEVQDKLNHTMLKQSQVMKAAGLGNPNDATARSLFSKKVRKDKNDDGGQYLFNDKELASIIKVLNNPSAYL